MSEVQVPRTPRAEASGLRLYLTGFVTSVVLTVVAFVLVERHLLPNSALLPLIIGLAMVQFVVQIVFFLHLATESKPKWKLTALVVMSVIVVIIVVGSLWIMKNLNYNMMTPTNEQNYLNSQDGL